MMGRRTGDGAMAGRGHSSAVPLRRGDARFGGTKRDGPFNPIPHPPSPIPHPYSPSRTVAMCRMPVPNGSSAAV